MTSLQMFIEYVYTNEYKYMDIDDEKNNENDSIKKILDSFFSYIFDQTTKNLELKNDDDVFLNKWRNFDTINNDEIRKRVFEKTGNLTVLDYICNIFGCFDTQAAAEDYCANNCLKTCIAMYVVKGSTWTLLTQNKDNIKNIKTPDETINSMLKRMEKDKLISSEILKNRVKKNDVNLEDKNKVDSLMNIYNKNNMVDVFTIENDGNVKKDIIFTDTDVVNISKKQDTQN